MEELKIKLAFAFIGTLSLIIFGITQKDYRTGTVYSVEDNIVVFETEDENLWKYKTNKEFKVGEKVTLAFFDFEDCNPENDTIVSVRKER